MSKLYDIVRKPIMAGLLAITAITFSSRVGAQEKNYVQQDPFQKIEAFKNYDEIKDDPEKMLRFTESLLETKLHSGLQYNNVSELRGLVAHFDLNGDGESEIIILFSPGEVYNQLADMMGGGYMEEEGLYHFSPLFKDQYTCPCNVKAVFFGVGDDRLLEVDKNGTPNFVDDPEDKGQGQII